jgi:hypothetical protein
MTLVLLTQEMEVLMSSIHTVSTTSLIGSEPLGLSTPVEVSTKEKLTGSQIESC